MKPRVFFVQPNTRFDVKDAERFGETQYLLPNQHGLDHMNPTLCMRLINEALYSAGFDPDVDYVALTGPNVLLNYLVAIVFAASDPVRLLIYDQRDRKYVERRAAVPVEQAEEIDSDR